MATNKLDKTGLAQVWAKITGGFATKQEVQQAVAGVYKFKGSVNFAALPTEGMQPGDVYNIKDEFTTTDAFAEGAAKKYPAGTNIAYTDSGWDCLAGIYDFSEYLKATDIVDITEAEIDEICTL